MLRSRFALCFAMTLLSLMAYSCSLPMIDHNTPNDGADAPKLRLNLQMPTLGGKQFWADWRWREGWRIQENVLTGHHRVLDDQDRRQAWGSWEACLAEFDRLAPHAPEGRKHLVVLVHGMGRGRATWSGLHRALVEQGFHVASITYPSTRRTIAEHVLQLESVLAHIEGYSKVSFMTHSLGAVVVRELLAPERAVLAVNDCLSGSGGNPPSVHQHQATPYWQSKLDPQRIVMTAPPNQGSAFAQRVEHFAPFGWIFGETGLSLTPRAMARVPIPQIPVLVIAGVRGTDGAWNPWLESPNDGVVSVAETHLEGEAGHLLVDNIHTFLMNDPVTIAAASRFLAGGSGFENTDVRAAHN